jgi:hypothetical protein
VKVVLELHADVPTRERHRDESASLYERLDQTTAPSPAQTSFPRARRVCPQARVFPTGGGVTARAAPRPGRRANPQGGVDKAFPLEARVGWVPKCSGSGMARARTNCNFPPLLVAKATVAAGALT